MVLEKMERYNESLEAYRKAIDLDGDLDRAWYRQGHVLLIVQRFDESLASLDKAVEFNPENAEAWNDKGVVLRKLERNEEALDCFQRAIQLDPSNELYRENLNDLGGVEPIVNSPGVISEKVLDFS
jgi:tetratricopeptide (TPR) repeat protein